MGSDYVINGSFIPDKQWIADNVGDEQVVMNMLNSFLGRMHLASHLEMLPERQLALVKEGIEYFDALSAVKKPLCRVCRVVLRNSEHLAW